jgi:Dolichyl-phosphate-mannose-protein mannosyltransferase
VLWTVPRVLAPLGALIVEGWPVAIGAVVFQEAGLALAGKLTDIQHRRVTQRLFLAAFVLRVAVAAPSHYIAKLGDGNGSLFQDAYTNDLVAEWLLRIARGEGISIFPGHQHLLDSSYTYLVFALYTIFGHAPLLPKLLNCALGALGAALVFEIARRAFSTRVAVLAAIGATLMPSLILWSVVTVKETLVLLMALVGLWALQRLGEGGSQHRASNALVLLVVAMVLSLDLRSTTTLVLLLLLPVLLVRRVQHRPRAWQLALIVLTLGVVVSGGLFVARGRVSGRPPGGVIEDVVLQIRHRRAQEAASARSQIRPERDVFTPEGRTELPEAEAMSDATPFSFAGDVLDPLGYALLAPAPWQAKSMTELAASGEMLAWYVLLGASFFAWRAPPRQRMFVACLVAYGVANWFVLAASEGNLGNLVRHRLMLAPTLLILGGAGLDWLWVHAARAWLGARWPMIDLRPRTPVQS